MNVTLALWIAPLHGILYDNYLSFLANNIPTLIEQHLNSITMVQSGGGSVTPEALALKALTYGYLVSNTEIPASTMLLVVEVFVALVCLLIWWMVLLRKLGKGKNELEPFPNDLFSWLLHATREIVFSGHEEDFTVIPEKGRSQ